MINGFDLKDDLNLPEDLPKLEAFLRKHDDRINRALGDEATVEHWRWRGDKHLPSLIGMFFREAEAQGQYWRVFGTPISGPIDLSDCSFQYLFEGRRRQGRGSLDLLQYGAFRGSRNLALGALMTFSSLSLPPNPYLSPARSGEPECESEACVLASKHAALMINAGLCPRAVHTILATRRPRDGLMNIVRLAAALAKPGMS